MSEADRVPVRSARNSELLGRIASTLSVSPTVFLQSRTVEFDAHEACELLQLWHGLDKPADRRKLIAFARALSTSDNRL